MGEEPNNTTTRSLVLFTSFNTLCSSTAHFITTAPEPVLVDLLRSPEINSQHGRRVRFCGSINVYKYGLTPNLSIFMVVLVLVYEFTRREDSRVADSSDESNHHEY